MSATKIYLGDGVYADEEVSGGVVLTTENGFRATNTIVLEPEVLRALNGYLESRRVRDREGLDVYGYPRGWPKCPGCGLPALDGHITCGDVACCEGSRR